MTSHVMRRRRPSLRRSSPICAAMGLIALVLLSSAVAAQTTRAARPYAAGRSALQIGSSEPTFLQNVSGGAISAEVIVESIGPERIAKRVGPPVYEELTVEVGLDARPLVDWIAESWAGKTAPRSGRILVTDFDGIVQNARSFTDARLAKTTVPTLDAASRAQGYLALTIDPGSIRNEPGDRSRLSPASKTGAASRWLVSNFRFALGDLATNRVSRIESFTVEHGVNSEMTDEMRAAQNASGGRTVIPNLRVTFAESDAKSWTAWHRSFIVDQRNRDQDEKAGAIELLAADLRTILARIELSQCGIFRLAADPVDQATTSMRRMIADLYCEQMRFEPGAIK